MISVLAFVSPPTDFAPAYFAFRLSSSVLYDVPVAQDTDYQTIKDVTYDVNGAEGKITEDALGNKMLYIEWVKETADENTKGKDTYLDKARAIYDWIIANMNRDESVKGCGQGDVCALLDTKGGKCTDINSVFVGLCRASGIPAREMFGVRINDTDITKNQHCWAEFYLPGFGWVAADPADVMKAVLKNSWDKECFFSVCCKCIFYDRSGRQYSHQ